MSFLAFKERTSHKSIKLATLKKDSLSSFSYRDHSPDKLHITILFFRRLYSTDSKLFQYTECTTLAFSILDVNECDVLVSAIFVCLKSSSKAQLYGSPPVK